MTLRCAAIQFAPKFKAVKDNQVRLGRLVMDAAQNGAKLIVLPELAVTGYSFMSAEEARPFAEDPSRSTPGTTLNIMGALAKRLNVHIAFGFIELDAISGKLYNSQGFVTPDGHFERYRKVNQWGNDFLWCSPGDSNPPVVRVLIDGKMRKIGLLICRDVRDKKGFDGQQGDSGSFYEKGDADIVCFSANWGDGGFPAVTWMEFAQKRGVHLVVSNRYGREESNNFGEGGSCLITPDGKVFCKGLVWNQDCIVYADIL